MAINLPRAGRQEPDTTPALLQQWRSEDEAAWAAMTPKEQAAAQAEQAVFLAELEATPLSLRMAVVMFTPEQVVKRLDAVASVTGETALNELQATIDALTPSLLGDEAVIEALFRVFERFPDDDGFGVFWAIVHAVETTPGGYEAALVRSVRRKPTEFNLLMVRRLLNAGVTEVDGTPLQPLLDAHGSVTG